MKTKLKNFFRIIIKQVLKVLYIFPLKKKVIYLLSFQGKTEYGYDAKAIVEYSNTHNLGYRFIWGYRGKKPIAKHKNVMYIKINSLRGLYYALTCQVFITNINPLSYIPYRKKQLVINTWHGFGPKKGGKYAFEDYDKKSYNLSQCFLSANDYYTNVVIRESFQFEGEVINIGFCRNDILFNKESAKKAKQKIKEKYNILDKNVLLYAPTFRGSYKKNKTNIDFNLILEALKNKYKKEWVILLRTHPNVIDKLFTEDERVIDVSKEEDIHDLICATDILISDYSSVMWDFAQTKRPVFMYVDDIKDYIDNDRALYSFFYEFPYYKAENNEDMIKEIENLDNKKYQEKLDKFFKKCNSYEKGNACEQLFNYIEKNKD